MLHMTCDFCGRQLENNAFQMFLQNMSDPNAETEKKIICLDCKKRYIDANTGKADAIEPILEDPEPGRAFTGMVLADFLRTDLYRTTQNIIFKTREDETIRNFYPWIRRHVLFVSMPNAKGETIVTLE